MKKIIIAAMIMSSLFLVSCAKSEDDKNAKKISFDSEKGCSEKTYTVKVGDTKFLAFNSGSEVGELEILEGDKVKSEVENIIGDTSKTFTSKLKAGEYNLICGSDDAPRSTLTVEEK